MTSTKIEDAYTLARQVRDLLIELHEPQVGTDLHKLREECFGELTEFAARFEHIGDHARQLAGAEIDADEAGEVVDGGALPFAIVATLPDLDKRNRRKWYKNRRSQKTGVLLHHTAPGGRGGFGVMNYRVRHYETPSMYRDVMYALSGQMPQEDWARLAALCERYAGLFGNYTGVAYHGISTAHPHALIYNLPCELWSWHGDDANKDYLGYAIDFQSNLEPVPHPATEVAKLIGFVDMARDDGHDITKLSVHGAWVNKPHDPGREAIEKVAVPAAAALNLEIDWDFSTNGGISMEEMVRA